MTRRMNSLRNVGSAQGYIPMSLNCSDRTFPGGRHDARRRRTGAYTINPDVIMGADLDREGRVCTDSRTVPQGAY